MSTFVPIAASSISATAPNLIYTTTGAGISGLGLVTIFGAGFPGIGVNVTDTIGGATDSINIGSLGNLYGLDGFGVSGAANFYLSNITATFLANNLNMATSTSTRSVAPLQQFGFFANGTGTNSVDASGNSVGIAVFQGTGAGPLIVTGSAGPDFVRVAGSNVTLNGGAGTNTLDVSAVTASSFSVGGLANSVQQFQAISSNSQTSLDLILTNPFFLSNGAPNAGGGQVLTVNYAPQPSATVAQKLDASALGSSNAIMVLLSGASSDTVMGGAGNDTIAVSAGALGGTAIDGGLGINHLGLIGSGTFNLASLGSLTNVQQIDFGNNTGSVLIASPTVLSGVSTIAGGTAPSLVLQSGSYDLTNLTISGSDSLIVSAGATVAARNPVWTHLSQVSGAAGATLQLGHNPDFSATTFTGPLQLVGTAVSASVFTVNSSVTAVSLVQGSASAPATTVAVAGAASTLDFSNTVFSNVAKLFVSTPGLVRLAAGASAANLPTAVVGGSGVDTVSFGPGFVTGRAFSLAGGASGSEADLGAGGGSTFDFSGGALSNVGVIRNLTGAATTVVMPTTSAQPVAYVGGSGNETVLASAAGSSVFGSGGSSVVTAGASTLVVGGGGLDSLVATGANTTIFGSDATFGTATQAKSITGAASGDVLVGRFQVGAGGTDTLIATSGAETLFGGAANALIRSTSTTTAGTVMVGGAASSTLIASFTGADTLFGGSGTSVLIANCGNQVLVGGTGAAQLNAAGSGSDTLFGGSGSDTYKIVQKSGGGTDVIVGFKPATDIIDLTSFHFVGSMFASLQVTTYSNAIDIQLNASTSSPQHLQIIGATSPSPTYFAF